MTAGEAEPTETTERPEWIIQRCTQRLIGTQLEYEDWPGYSERLMSHAEVLDALKECELKWPEHEFRGHNALKQSVRMRPGLRSQHT